MKAGTIVRLADGREGTVVYNGLDGVGIKFGRHAITLTDVEGNGLFGQAPTDYPYYPNAMLRETYPSADLPCVGTNFEVIEEPSA
jgi:hypothetical protein